jgi:hypothetical protein
MNITDLKSTKTLTALTIKYALLGYDMERAKIKALESLGCDDVEDYMRVKQMEKFKKQHGK